MRPLPLKKKSSFFLFIFLLCFALLNAGTAFAQKQTKKDLENKKKQLQKEIEATNQLLAETKKKQKTFFESTCYVEQKN